MIKSIDRSKGDLFETFEQKNNLHSFLLDLLYK